MACPRAADRYSAPPRGAEDGFLTSSDLRRENPSPVGPEIRAVRKMALSHLSPVCSDSREQPWVSSNQPSGKGPDLSFPSGNARQAVLAALHPSHPSPQPDAGGSGDWEQEHIHPPTWGTPLLGTPAKETTIQQEKHACTANPRSSSEQRGLEQLRGAGKAPGWVHGTWS